MPSFALVFTPVPHYIMHDFLIPGQHSLECQTLKMSNCNSENGQEDMAAGCKTHECDCCCPFLPWGPSNFIFGHCKCFFINFHLKSAPFHNRIGKSFFAQIAVPFYSSNEFHTLSCAWHGTTKYLEHCALEIYFEESFTDLDNFQYDE
jgi:hypothetical protein